MKNILFIPNLLFFPAVIFLFSSCSGNSGFPKHLPGKSYYISQEGDDGNPGTLSEPFKSLQKVNSLALNPGDKIFLEGGKVFKGPLILDSLDKGKKASRVQISSYGTGPAVINGADAEGIIVTGCEEFVVRNINVTGNGRKDGNKSDGILISDSRKFVLDSLEVSGFQHSGIHVHTGMDIEITHIYAHDNGFAGINLTGTTIYNATEFDNENIYISHCRADNNPGDPSVTDNHSGNGILVSSGKNCTIEYCEASNNGWDMPWTGNGPVGIWIWDCTQVLIQYCISHDNKTNPVAKDGGGFDLDGGVSNSVIQYCLSYNNLGAGFGLFEFGAGKPWENNTIRYNISNNDGVQNPGSVSVWKGEGSGIMRNCDIYNNTFINDTVNGVSLYVLNNCPGFNFRNNIFIYRSGLLFKGQKLTTELFQGNCYWSPEGNGSVLGFANLKEWSSATGNEMLDKKFVGKYGDPLLLNQRKFSSDDPSLISNSVSAFSPHANSPLIDNGLHLKELFNLDLPQKDIAGTSLPVNKTFDIGAIEFVRK
jgi:hypothetical protein